MNQKLTLTCGQRRLSPELADFAQQITDLGKLAIVQGLAADAAPSSISLTPTRMRRGRAARRLGKIATDHVKASRTSPKRTAVTDPIAELVDADLSSLARRYGVDLAAPKDPFEQVTKERFRFAVDFLENDSAVTSWVEGTHGLEIFPEVDEERPDPALPTFGLEPASSAPSASVVSALGLGKSKPGAGAGISVTVPPTNKELEFRVHSVRCIEETRPKFPGNDRIAIGGVAFNSSETVGAIGERLVKDGFKDGVVKRYSPPLVLHRFPLSGASYPSEFAVAVALAEKDSSGFSDFLAELWETVREEIDEIIVALSAALAAKLGASAGSAAGSLAGPIGTVIGAVVGAAIGALVVWLVKVTKDDLFEPQAAAVELPNKHWTFSGSSRTSPRMALHF
ncbi:MAG: hypothetical protein AAGG01_14445, partial [Planctomycetota bacterium]